LLNLYQMEYIQLLGGLLLLFFSGDYLVRGGVSLARIFKISPLVIGVTVVAFGTSAPELIVSVNAALTGHPEISIGNVIGSNIANIGLVLGLTSMVLALPVQSDSIRFDWPVMMLASVIFYFSLADGIVGAWEGISFLLILSGFIFLSIYRSRKLHKKQKPLPDEKIYSLGISLLFVTLSCVGLAFGSELLIRGASGIARMLGVTERVISITLIAFGTSVPELTASLIAAFKKQTDISIGNIIGSNIFNIFAVIGTASTIHVIEVDSSGFAYDVLWMLLFALLLLLFSWPFFTNLRNYRHLKKPIVLLGTQGGVLVRWSGFILTLGYLYYIYTLF